MLISSPPPVKAGVPRHPRRHFLSALGVAALMAYSSIPFPARADGVQVGRPAPRLDTQTLGGRLIRASQLDGKVVLQYFWASWCPVCRAHLPRLQSLYDAYRPRGFEIIAQSLDDNPIEVAEFWRRGGYTFPVAMALGKARTGYEPIVATPTLFLVDKRGIVRLSQMGTLPDTTLEAHINTLLRK